MDAVMKKLAIQHQVVAEANDRDNTRLVEQIGEWLTLEEVDADLRKYFLTRIAEMATDLSKANEFIKKMMDMDAAKAA